MTYSEKLRDPRWQKMRLHILHRDEWKCKLCGNSHRTLHVHHMDYIANKEPWDYPEHYLVTLCESCHEMISVYEKELLSAFRFQLLDETSIQFLISILKSKHLYSILTLLNEIINRDTEEELIDVLREKLFENATYKNN